MNPTEIRFHVKNEWDHLCESINLHPNKVNYWWHVIEKNYSQSPPRFYHTLTHLHEMILHFVATKDHIHRPHHVLFAIFFHDVIYNSKGDTNEEESAQLFSDFAKETSLKENSVRLIFSYIISTKSHNSSMQDDSDLDFFLDYDIAVFGKPYEDYLIYASQIRKEYIHIPKSIYCEERIKILQDFLSNNQRIFSTSVFEEMFGKVARSNLVKEINLLKDKKLNILKIECSSLQQ